MGDRRFAAFLKVTYFHAKSRVLIAEWCSNL